MIGKRFEFREINEPPILPKCYDTEKQEYANLFGCVGWLNELHEENQDLTTKKEDEEYELLHLKEKYEESLEENEQLKEVLGSILIEVRRDISATNHSCEVKAFVTPNSFDLISDVLKKYGALKDWYE